MGRGVHQARQLRKDLLVLLHPLDGVQRRHGLEAPHAGGETPVGDDLERADLTGAAHVAAAAELDREAGDVDDPDPLGADAPHIAAPLLTDDPLVQGGRVESSIRGNFRRVREVALAQPRKRAVALDSRHEAVEIGLGGRRGLRQEREQQQEQAHESSGGRRAGV